MKCIPPRQAFPANVPEPLFPALSALSRRLAEERWTLATPRIHRCEAAWRWRPAPLPDFDFWTVLSGRGELTVATRPHILRAGTWFLLQPGDEPAGRHDPRHPLVVFACHFSRPQPGRLTAEVATGHGVPLTPEAEATVRAWTEGTTGRVFATAQFWQMVHRALHAAAQGASPARTRITQIAQEIRSAPGAPWTVPAMARRGGLSVAQFQRVWRAALGTSPGRYLIEQRVRRATELLRESDLTIEQIAEALHYADTPFFHRQFRRFAGVTPRAARLGAPTRLDETREKL